MSEANAKPSSTRGPWRWQFFGKVLALVGAHSDIPIVMDVTPRGKIRMRDGNRMVEVLTVHDAMRSPDLALIAGAPELLRYAKLEEEYRRIVVEELGYDSLFRDKHGVPDNVSVPKWLEGIRRAALASVGGEA